MDPTPAEIRRQQFEQVRRGFDPQEVGVFLERIAGMIAARDKDAASQQQEVRRLERAIDEARAAEEAVRLTMVAATRAKDEILAAANEEAGDLLEQARAEAESAIADARRDALVLIEESRKDAEELMSSVRSEHRQLDAQVAAMRDVIRKAGNLLKGMASGALEDLSHATTLLEEGGAALEAADFELDVGELSAVPAQDVAGADDPVDRLLAQLRRAGG